MPEKRAKLPYSTVYVEARKYSDGAVSVPNGPWTVHEALPVTQQPEGASEKPTVTYFRAERFERKMREAFIKHQPTRDFTLGNYDALVSDLCTIAGEAWGESAMLSRWECQHAEQALLPTPHASCGGVYCMTCHPEMDTLTSQDNPHLPCGES